MDRRIFESYLAKIGISLNDKQHKQFDTFYEMLVEWNKVMNLTGITEYDEVVLKHYIDSIIVGNVFDFSNVKSIIDIGTGAGFPGIPLKIVYPDKNMVLLDSLNKRINYLNAVIENTGLLNIKTIHGRAEDYAKIKEYREQFDLCVSRAVANLSSLCEYCLPYVKSGGYFISYKSGKIDEELAESKKAISVLGGELSEVKYLTLPDSDIERAFVIIKKVKSTPKSYPRKAGLPSKEPIK